MNSDKPIDETGALRSAERDLSQGHEVPEVVLKIFLVWTYGRGTPEAAEVGGRVLGRERSLSAGVAPTG